MQIMPEENPSTTRVLVAEDDSVTSKLLVYRLSREPGFEVEHYPDGLDALDALSERDFDLAILDVQMPGMDGLGVLARMRADPRHVATPVIMLTSLGTEQDVVRGLESGANDYMVKPFSPAELMARVRRQLYPPVAGMDS
jgi:DNA-binding response OmpR family regulator